MNESAVLEYIKRNKWIATLFNTFFVLVFSIILPVRFEENDDVMMLLFSSGRYTGEPESILVFINHFYGIFLKQFYLLFPSVEWYTLFFLIFHILSLIVIINSVLLIPVKRYIKLLFILIIYLIEIRLIFQLQFTTTSALLALAGLILIINKKKIKIVLGVFLFLLSSLLRFEAAFLVLLVLLPLFIFLLSSNSNNNNKKEYILALVFAVGISILIKNYEELYMNNLSEWSYFFNFNIERGKFNDNPNVAKSSIKESNIVHKDDLILLEKFIPDGNVINLNDLKEINSLVSKVGLKDKFTNIYASLRKYSMLLLFLLIIILGIYYGLDSKYVKLFYLLHCLFFISALCYVSMNATLNYRVFISALLPIIFVLIYYAAYLNTNKSFKLIILISLVSFLMLFTKRTYNLWKQKDGWAKNEFVIQQKMVDLYFSSSRKPMVLLDFSLDSFNALNISNYFDNKRIVGVGWLTNTPYNKDFNSHEDLINNDIFISKYSLENTIPHMTNSLKLNYGIDVDVKIVMYNKDFYIIKFVRL